MKKAKFTLLLALSMLLCGFLLMGCLGNKPDDDNGDDDNTIKNKIELVTSIETVYVVGESVNFANVLKVKHYNNEGVANTITYNGSNMTLSSFSTEEAGEYEVTITYSGLSTKVELEVVEAILGETISEVQSFNPPALIATYNENIEPLAPGQKDIEFTRLNDPYVVGTNNDFIFEHSAEVIKIVGERFASGDYKYINLNVFDAEVKLESSATANGTFTEITGTNLTNIADFSKASEGRYKFKETAITGDKFYKLTVSIPEEFRDDSLNTNSYSFTFKVVKGTNVYDLAGFSGFDNSNTDAWASLKTANNVVDSPIVVLHTDLNLTVDNLPSSYFEEGATLTIEEGADKTPTVYEIPIAFVDNTKVFRRAIGENETAGIYGNYFNIDASKIPLSIRDNSWAIGENIQNKGGPITNNISLFDFANAGDPTNAKAFLRNVSTFGNGGRSDSIVHGGSTQLLHATVGRFDADNTIASGFFTTYNLDYTAAGHNVAKIKDSKSTNSYSCMVYSWQHPEMYFENTILKNSGGPVIVLNDFLRGSETVADKIYPRLFIDDLSKIETQVSGEEAWFSLYGAAELVAYLQPVVPKLNELSGGAALSAYTASQDPSSYGAFFQAKPWLSNAAPKTINKAITSGGTPMFNIRVVVCQDFHESGTKPYGEVYVGTEKSGFNASAKTQAEIIAQGFVKVLDINEGDSSTDPTFSAYYNGGSPTICTTDSTYGTLALMTFGTAGQVMYPISSTGVALQADDSVSVFTFFASDLNNFGMAYGDSLNLIIISETQSLSGFSIAVMCEYVANPTLTE